MTVASPPTPASSHEPRAQGALAEQFDLFLPYIADLPLRDQRESGCEKSFLEETFPRSGQGRGRAGGCAGGKGSGAPVGNQNAWKHGAQSAEVMELAQTLREIERLMRDEELLRQIQRALCGLNKFLPVLDRLDRNLDCRLMGIAISP